MKNKLLFFQYITKYLDEYCRCQAGKSYYTIKSYRDNLTVFRRFLLKEKGLKIRNFYMDDCTKDLILDYVKYLRNNNKSSSTINHHISAIKGYLYYVADCDISYQGLAITISHIPFFKEPKKEKECLDSESLRLLFEAPKNNKIGIRNRTILILLYDTAMRVGELVNLKMCDLFLSNTNPMIKIHGKGDKDRIVVLSDRALEHINIYLNLFHKNNICNYVFYTVIKGVANKLSESTIETFIQKYADQVKSIYPKIPDKVYPHMFRRSRATHLYQDGTPLEIVSTMLGHSNIDTTKIYAKPSMNQLREAIQNQNDINIEQEWEDEDEIASLFGLR